MTKTPYSMTPDKGFALVVTLSLMVLLAVVCIGLLGLSAVSLRSSSQALANAEAQANARLALMMAIGELQKQLGPDQRVSASGAILADATVLNPHWTGVWDSWRAGAKVPGTTTPDATSEHRTIAGASNSGMAPTYAPQRKDHFRSWLVSLAPTEAGDISSAQNLSITGDAAPGKNATAVQLVGKGALGQTGSAQDYVSARLLALQSGAGNAISSGRYAWWIGDESQKARILNDSYGAAASSLTSADKIFRSQAPASTGTTRVKGLENVTDDTQLKGLPSLHSLNLVNGVTGKPAENFLSITPYSHAVIADVREGGLKKDLSTLLERPISVTETDDSFMLYKFNTKDQWIGSVNQECVPIQDLAAYYQLHDSTRTGWKEGSLYSSNLLRSGLQIVSPDYGFTSGPDPYFAQQFSALYRQPALVKLQFLLSMYAQPIPKSTTTDTHMLLVGITPSITLWNPTNLPLVMRFDARDPNRYAQLLRTGTFPLSIQWTKNGQRMPAVNLTWLSYNSMADAKAQLLNLFFSGKNPVTFAPGEVKTFSLPFSGDMSGTKQGGDGHIGFYNDSFLFKTDKFYANQEVAPGWDPRSFMLFNSSAQPISGQTVNRTGLSGKSYSCLAFKASDSLSFVVSVDDQGLGTGDGSYKAPFYFKLIQACHQCYTAYGGTAEWGRNNYVFNSRNGGAPGFSQSMMSKGFPGGVASIVGAPRSGTNLITRSNTQEGWPFLQFALQAGVETSANSNVGQGAGRQFASRPFLHSSALPSPFADDSTNNSLYNLGWNWSIGEINEVTDAPVQVSANNEGYYGGGYTAENGSTRIVQQEIPVLPPINIAALSHARLGGYSIGNVDQPNTQVNQVATVTGQAGLFPHTLQAIGNSYAHPLIPADKAFVSNYSMTFDSQQGAKNITIADHSYLANKALWDDYFFSSITPKPSSVRLFESTPRALSQVANDFFFMDTPLPNRRILPYTRNLDQAKLAGLLGKASRYSNGLADLIAAHLMVEGPFNINSTSGDAWKVFLSSLKGKPVAYLDKDKALGGVTKPDQATPSGTTASGFTMPNGKAVDSSPDPANADQWTNPRELSDAEIDQLAAAIVRQVKLRGPFLSVSEFVNRRLDAQNTELSLKGALQAALDDNSVSINANFRNNARQFSDAEQSSMSAAFPDAMKGPVAYGSAAYVDQADILRNFSEQITPRGDSFVIRTYGDSLDSQGNVRARAWCEAVVQRVPDYLDQVTDEAHLRLASLRSSVNKTFGRKLRLMAFRWLDAAEI